jgi:hypothetical protein
MSTEAWIALFTTIGAVIALIKFGFSEYVKVSDKVLDKETKAHQKTQEEFGETVKLIEMQYKATLKEVVLAKQQLGLAQSQYSETNQMIKKFISLTKAYIEDNEKKLLEIETQLKDVKENLGKIIRVGK